VEIYRRFGQEIVTLGSWKKPTRRSPARTYLGRPWWSAEEQFFWYVTHTQASGWPLLSLNGWCSHHVLPATAIRGVSIVARGHWAIVLHRDVFGRADQREAEVLLPLRPMWPGMVLNTLFYAITLGLLLGGIAGLHRTMRRRRGLCPRCAYPVGDSERCSECGTPVPARRASAG
jgi:hypothetical protein